MHVTQAHEYPMRPARNSPLSEPVANLLTSREDYTFPSAFQDSPPVTPQAAASRAPSRKAQGMAHVMKQTTRSFTRLTRL